MATRLLTRSKTLTLAFSRADAAAAAPLAFGGHWLRAISSLPRDPAAAAASPPAMNSALRSPVGIGKILGYEQASLLTARQVLPRWFSTGAPSGSTMHQAESSQISEVVRKTVAGMEHTDANAKEGASSNVMAFSPLEATVVKARKGPLAVESLKLRRAELSGKVTYYMIPALLLVSKNSLSTSLLVLAVFHQIYLFNKEIFLDYVHHEITRKWVLLYFKLLLLILAKDTIIYFNLV